MAPPSAIGWLKRGVVIQVICRRKGICRVAPPENEFIFYSEAPPTFDEAKVVKLFETEMDALKFCSH